MPTSSPPLRWGSTQGRWVLAAAVLGSGIAGIDATVVNVALPALGEDLDADFAVLQWVVTGYAVTLASFILLGGTLGDRFGRRRVFVAGVVWFAVASVLCGAAPSGELLVAARILQGVGGALLTPASLAILQAGFAAEDRGRAIGAWSGLGGVATAVGPFLGGWLVEAVSWRWVFLINVPVAALVVWVAWRHVPESRDRDAHGSTDWPGSVLAAVALAGLTYAAIGGSGSGAGAGVLVALAVGCGAAAAFVLVERRSPNPVLPPSIFRSRQFDAVNAVTFVVYGALGTVFFLLVVQLQVVSGFGAVAAGTALLPVTAVMLLLSARSGQLASRIGPRLQMTVGPVVCALSLLWMIGIGQQSDYVRDVLPPVVLFGLGLAIMVAPLTTAALAVVPDSHAGLASGVNNAVARTGGLAAVAVVPAVVGLTGADYADPRVFDAAFDQAMVIAGVVLVAGAVLAGVSISNVAATPAEEAAEPRGPEVGPVVGAEGSELRHLRHCAVSAPPPVTCVRSGSARVKEGG